MSAPARESLLQTVSAAPPDPILGLTEAFQKDNRADKVNLTIGVYRDAEGKTPILECVKQAEQRLVDTESTKGYLGIDGLKEFTRLAGELTLGGLVPAERVAGFQTPGGTGALRVAADFLGRNFKPARIWLSTPTWPNHPPIFQAAGIEVLNFPYLSDDKKSLDIEQMLATLEAEARPGDLVCLHACCHNPTGVDPTSEHWKAIAELTARKGMLPVIDFAYHGFGDGLEEDRRGLAAMAAEHDEFIVCSSYSKNFGLYSERIGAMFAVCPNAEAASKVGSNVKQTVRCNYSNPPRHGGAIVATVLSDDELRRTWQSELKGMCRRIHDVRQQFVDQMRDKGAPVDFGFLLDQRGMFSFSGLTPMQVDWLRSEKGIYIVGSGRINVAGITPANIDGLTSAITESLSV